jgi:hypothetical protein
MNVIFIFNENYCEPGIVYIQSRTVLCLQVLNFLEHYFYFRRIANICTIIKDIKTTIIVHTSTIWPGLAVVFFSDPGSGSCNPFLQAIFLIEKKDRMMANTRQSRDRTGLSSDRQPFTCDQPGMINYHFP